MLKYLKYDFLRMKNIIIGFLLVIIVLSVGLGVSNSEFDKYQNQLNIVYQEQMKVRDKEAEIYKEKLEDPSLSEEEINDIYNKIEEKSMKIAKNNILNEKSLDMDKIEKKVARTGIISQIITILIGVFIALFIGYSIVKFREDLFTERGYLTFSLPIKTIDILLTKYITGIVTPMLILCIGFLIAKNMFEKVNITLKIADAFYMSTTIIAFITTSYMYLALSKIGNKFLEKAWGLFIGLTGIVIVFTLLYKVGNYSTTLTKSLETISIPLMAISIVAVIITERTIRKRLTI